MELPRERELEPLSKPSNSDAPNQVKVVNALPPGQKMHLYRYDGVQIQG